MVEWIEKRKAKSSKGGDFSERRYCKRENEEILRQKGSFEEF